MKKLLIVFLLIVSLIPVSGQDYFNHKKNQNRNHLVLVHPTRSNLERYSYLIEENILDPGKLKIVGVYFEAENYDYSGVIVDYPHIGFHMVPEGLEEDMMYTENIASKEFNKIFRYSKAIIFNGGPDIPPSMYGEEMNTLTRISDPYRHIYEVSFLFHLVGGPQDSVLKPLLKNRPRYVILGICLGMQSMNIANGGSLVQDIPSELYGQNTVETIMDSDPAQVHRNYYSDFKTHPEIKSYFLHPIKLVNGRWLEIKTQTNNPEPWVYSSHHQCIKDLGEDYRATAFSSDGKIIEGIEHSKYPRVTGLQFHPEVDWLYRRDKMLTFLVGEPGFNLPDKLKEHDSHEFHYEFWKAFSKLLN